MKFIIKNVMFCGYFGDNAVFSQDGKCRMFRIFYGSEKQLSKSLVSILMDIECTVDEEGILTFVTIVEK